MTHTGLRRLATALVASAPLCSSAAETIAVPFDSPGWKVEAVESRVEEHMGRQSLYLKGGGALLEGVQLEDGVVEFDVAFGPERGFCGIAFRMESPADYEHFYLRPHQSGQPDSLQYTPNLNGVSGWQLYHGPGYGAAVTFPTHRWIHVEVRVAGGQAEAYVDSEDPVLFMHDLKRSPREGGLGLVVGNFAPAHFSNFAYRRGRPELKGRAPETPPAPEGSVMAWEVSDSFDAKSLDASRSLGAADLEGRRWTPLRAEASGIANLARVQGIAKGADTAFVRLRLRSAAAGVRPLELGYSDRVRVYLNGVLLYSGDNTYQSRDFRYLGTIGLFDSLPLRLRAGDNEVLFAVSEAFGGWGIQARLPEREGIEILP